jgi:predicted esterase
MSSRRWIGGLLALCAAALLLAACGGGDEGRDASRAPPEGDRQPGSASGASLSFSRLPGITTAREFGDELGDEGIERWENEFPEVEDVRIDSSADEHRQPALWLPPSEEGDRPLLVVLHSWSNGYKQHIGIPFGRWAERQGWAMIAPHFRGVNNKPAATGSDRAVQDVIDAVEFAREEADIDEERIFVIGFSGGGMMSLLMAGRHPDRFAGAVAWVPVHDLAYWHRYNAGFDPPRDYAAHIARSCGGDPNRYADARRSCRRRSPSEHLDSARRAGMPVYIGHGADDTLVPPDHALRAFNRLADPGDRIGARSIRRVGDNRLPDHLRGSVDTPTYFGEQDPRVRFARRSGDTTVVLFEGEHDMVYHPGLEWMTRVAQEGDED